MSDQPVRKGRYPIQPRDSEGYLICSIDGIRLEDHLKCSRCSILIGPVHHERRGVEIDGKMYCIDCSVRRK